MAAKQKTTPRKYTNATKGKPKAERKKRIPYGAPGGLALIPGWAPKTFNPKPEHAPTERSRTMVEMMVAFGTTQRNIAEALDISPMTLVKHYREELTLGAMRANMAVVMNLYRLATSPETNATVFQAAQWWTKSRMGWTEIRRTMSDVRTVSGNMRDLSDAQLIEIIEGARIGESEPGDFPEASEPGEFS